MRNRELRRRREKLKIATGVKADDGIEVLRIDRGFDGLVVEALPLVEIKRLIDPRQPDRRRPRFGAAEYQAALVKNNRPRVSL